VLFGSGVDPAPEADSFAPNMLPDRVRAIVVDGVIGPVAWAGTPRTVGEFLDGRRRVGAGRARDGRGISSGAGT
jgi:hypothetical protein